MILHPSDKPVGLAARSAVATAAGGRVGLSDASLLAILLLVAVVPFLNALLNGFVYDDLSQVLNNPYVQTWGYLREIFSTHVWSYIGVRRVTNYFRPMMTFGYLLTFQLFGPLSFGFHLVNVVIHSALVCVLFAITTRLFPDRLTALLAAGLFALHPIHSEAVAWIAAVTELELALFYLLAFWAFLAIDARGKARQWLAVTGMAASYVLALFSKEQALTLPLLATIYEHFFRPDRRETRWKQKTARYGVLWALAAGYILLRIHVLGSFAPVKQMSDLTWRETILSSLALCGQYLGKLVWPVQLCAFYAFRKSVTLLDIRVLFGVAALLLCLGVFLFLWKHSRSAAFGIVWLLVTLAPVMNPRWMTTNVFAERYLYLPSAGFCWMAAWLWSRIWVRQANHFLWRATLAGVLALIASLAALRIIMRNREWNNDIVLFTRTLEVSPNALVVRNSLGVAYMNEGKMEAAEQQWQYVLREDPNSFVTLGYLGQMCARQKRYDEAERYMLRVLAMMPTDTEAHRTLGIIYAERNLPQRAEKYLNTAIALSPLDAAARNRLGRLYLEQGRLNEAAQQFRRSVESAPNAAGYDGLGDLRLLAGDREKARSAFQHALSLDPFDSHAHFGLGKIYALEGRPTEAVRELRAGLELDPTNTQARKEIEQLGLRGNKPG